MGVEKLQTAQDDTREKLLAAAHRQFADRGFYGASIAQIAGEVGLTKQALLYHFKRKEDLYRAVLKSIAERSMAAMRAGVNPSKPAAQQFEDIVLGIYAAASANRLDTKVLMREILDDQRRDAPPEEWFFRTYLDEILAALDSVAGMEKLPRSTKLARIYHLISAIEYFSASEQVLRRFYGDEEYARISDDYPEELRAQIHHALNRH